MTIYPAGSWIYGNGVGCEGERGRQLEAAVARRHISLLFVFDASCHQLPSPHSFPPTPYRQIYVASFPSSFSSEGNSTSLQPVFLDPASSRSCKRCPARLLTVSKGAGNTRTFLSQSGLVGSLVDWHVHSQLFALSSQYVDSICFQVHIIT